MNKKYLEVRNLNCANCARKIENEISRLNVIESAVVDFAGQRIIIEAEKAKDLPKAEAVQQIADRIENGVKISEEDTLLEKKNYLSVITFSISAVLLAASLLIPLPAGAVLGLMVLAAVFSAYDTFLLGVKAAKNLEIDENILLIIAVTAAFLIGEGFEGVIVTLFFRAGNFLESLALSHSRHSIKKLVEIRPQTARVVLKNGSTQTIKAEEVEVGEMILIHPHERIPIDGIVMEGAGMVDASAITGESLPKEASLGTKLLSGMLNGGSPIKLQTTESFQNSAASKIIDLVKDSAAQKGESERLITRFSKIFVPIVCVIAFSVALFPPLFLQEDFSKWIYNALVILVAACPCALVISVPLGFFAAIGRQAKLGVLVKGGKFLETLAKSKTIVFDKTGTLTKNELVVKNIFTFDGFGESQVLALAAALETHSSHPIAKAVIAKAAGLKLPAIENIQEKTGFGLVGEFEGREVLCGSSRLMAEKGVDKAGTGAQLYLAVGKRLKGAIRFSSPLAEGVADTIQNLKKDGMENFAILSGDSSDQVSEIAKECKIDTFYSSLLPEDKLARLNEIKKSSGKTIYVGDGINDSPVLAAADAGVAMGLGSDIAIEAADIILSSGGISVLQKSRLLAKRALKIIYFNIWFSLFIKAIVIICGAVGYANMWLAVFADVGVSVITILNATRILNLKR